MNMEEDPSKQKDGVGSHVILHGWILYDTG
jgi:hypothetical protein